MIRVFLPDLPGTRIPNFYPDMPIIKITSLSHPGVEIFSSLTEAQLRNRLEPTKGIFIAESPKVIRVALSAGYEPLALLCEPKHIEGDAADIIACHANLPIYTGEREILSQLSALRLPASSAPKCRRSMPQRPTHRSHTRCDRHDQHRSHLSLGRSPRHGCRATDPRLV